MFINYTNHPSALWGDEQKEQAMVYGRIVDIPFPDISPQIKKEEMYHLAGNECRRLLSLLQEEKDSAVLCQGEFTFTYLMVKFLQEKRIKVLSAVSERKVKEVSDGNIVRKESEFCFQGFREYDFRRMPEDIQQELHPSVYNVVFNPGKEKRDTILITPLGAGGYQNTVYIDEKKEKIATTGYAFDAVVKKENPNKLLFIGTSKSNWSGVLKWYSLDLSEKGKEEGEKIAKNLLTNDVTRSDWKQAEKFICNAGGFEKVNMAIIPNGSTEEQLKEYFNILFDSFHEILDKNRDTKIIFDISNGFRSIPLYMMMFIRYVGMISKKKISYTVYYGMFDAREKNATPLVNLTTISELTEWINAISEFRSFGSVKKLYECLELEKNDHNKKQVDRIIKEFENFNYALNSNNLYYLEVGIKYIAELDMENLPLSDQAILMLSDLKADFASRFDNENKIYPRTWILVKLSQLFTEQGRYGAAAVSLQESIITYIMERYVRTYLMDIEGCDEEEYNEYIQNYNNRKPVKEHFDRKVKAYKDRTAESINFSKKMQDFMELYGNIKDNIRNVNAHIISKKDIGNWGEMEKWLNESIKLLLNDMKSFGIGDNSIGFQKIYEDFKIDLSTAGCTKAAIEFIKGSSKKQWNLISESKPELLDVNRKKLTAAGIKIERIQQLRQELIYVKNKSESNEDFRADDLKKLPLTYQILTVWFEADRNQKPQTYDLLLYLQTKKDKKGNKKSGYERLKSSICNNLVQKVLKILTE